MVVRRLAECLPHVTLAHLLFAEGVHPHVGDGLVVTETQTILNEKGQLLGETHGYLTTWGREVWLHSNRNRKFLQSHQEPWPLSHWPLSEATGGPRLSFSGCLLPTSSLPAVWLSLLFPAQRGWPPSGLRVSSPSLFRQDDSPEFSVPETF